MSAAQGSLRALRAAQRSSRDPRSLYTSTTGSPIASSRSFGTSSAYYATPSLHPTTRRDQQEQTKGKKPDLTASQQYADPTYKSLTPAERAARATERVRTRLEEQSKKFTSESTKLGGLADNSLFAEEKELTTGKDEEIGGVQRLDRSFENMSLALNPNPDARARWQRKMLIRHIRHRGRLPREVQIARTERSHLSRSHFFKTSMKKLAPLARQIAGKPIEEAILQMRFSKKKDAKDIRAHLVQARDEAIVMRGMGLNKSEIAEAASKEPKDDPAEKSAKENLVDPDPAMSPPLPHQNPTKSLKDGFEKSPTDIYIAQAWVNRGAYGMEFEPRARGRVNILRPPWTGISVLLKEEKTRTREKADKEAKAIRKRMGKNKWVQLPDRPITRQSQYVLW